MSKFAVIDIETTYSDKLLSIGVAVANTKTLELVDKMYYIIAPECTEPSMYSYALIISRDMEYMMCERGKAIDELKTYFSKNNIKSLFAYNASFDYNHIPEFSDMDWHDIMRIAAYKQYNKKIPCNAECCKTGRLKKNFGVEPIMRLLSGNNTYRETHNALFDALDELKIMQLLEHKLDDYIKLKG